MSRNLKSRAPLNNALAFWLSQKEVDQGEQRREYRDIFKTFNTEQRLFEKPRRARISAVFSLLRPLPIGSLFAAGLALKTLTERPSQIAKRIVQRCPSLVGAWFESFESNGG